MSLRPLAQAIGSSPRVLLFLFGSKDGLISALLSRARKSELELLAGVHDASRAGGGLAHATQQTWIWLSDRRHRPLLRLWVEAYSRSLTEPAGPWRGFAEQTVRDWLDLLADSQPAAERRTKRGLHERTRALAILRGALLDLLATDDLARVSGAVTAHVRELQTRS